MTGATAYRYRLFGLVIESALRLPELTEQADDGQRPPDIRIRFCDGAVTDDAFELDIPEVARFVIAGGRSITVGAAAGAEEREVRLFLLGSAMGVVLHQRGVLPLHANAVAIDGAAIAFTGPSGSGKSTLAAWFHDRGYRVLADDVCVVRTDDGRAMAFPGLPRLRLWQDALEASGRDPGAHVPSFSQKGDPRRKYDVTLTAEGVMRDPLPLRALFVLEQGPVLAIERLTGAESVEAISSNTYRGGLIGQVGDSAVHLEACLTIARQAQVYRLRRSFDRAEFEPQCIAVLDYCRGLPSG